MHIPKIHPSLNFLSLLHISFSSGVEGENDYGEGVFSGSSGSEGYLGDILSLLETLSSPELVETASSSTTWCIFLLILRDLSS